MKFWVLAGRFAISFLLASILILPIVLAQNCTNCTVTMVNVEDGKTGTILSITLYLIIGFIALYFIPRITTTPDKKLQATYASIVGDAWRRGIYACCLLMYYIMGVWVYQAAVGNGIEITWLFTLSATLFSIVMFLLFGYCMLKLIADGIALVMRRIDAERYGRNWRD
jgi:predicted membrane channel-forming protein YqfA (hemolysin III family)